MVKGICYTLAAIAVSLGLFFFSQWYMNKQFEEFSQALDALYTKVEEKTASQEDGYAVKTLWAEKKSKLHIFVPHNDISYIDYWLNEACGLLRKGEYELALGNVEVLKEIAKNLPDAYSIRLENVF